MGVKGLSVFIQSNAECLLKTERLNDTSLVVDGYNILHELYYSSEAETAYGGDYCLFAKLVESFCNHLLLCCSITPIFIFDGASEFADRKFRTTLNRAKERIHMAGIASHRKRTKILPCLAFRTLVDKLCELHIPHCVCDHEADSQLASLANELKCPLASNDTDFLLQDLPAGVISINDLNVTSFSSKETGEQSNELVCPVFKRKNLADKYGLKDPSILHLLSVICGNDSFSPDSLHNFRKTLDKKAKCLHIDSYMKWLAQFETSSEAVEGLIRKCQASERLAQSIRDTVESYKVSSNHLSSFLSEEHLVEHTDTHPLHSHLPPLFWSRYRSALISKRILELAFFHRRIFATQMEDMRCPSSWCCSSSIRQKIYQIMSASMPTPMSTVKEYDREEKKLMTLSVPVEPAAAGECLSLASIYQEDEKVRLKMFYQALGLSEEMINEGVVSPDCPSRKDNDVLTAIILYWVNQSQPQLYQIHVMAVLVCIVNFSLIGDHVSKKERICQLTSRHDHIPSQDQKHSLGLEMTSLQAMAQFQSVLSDGLDLLGLLAVDVSLRVDEVFSGRYIYNLTIELSKRIDPAAYCEEMLVRGSDFCQLYRSWYELIVSHAKNGRLAEVGNSKVASETLSKAAKQRAKNQKKKRRSVLKVESESEEDVDLDCLANNKFAALVLAEK